MAQISAELLWTEPTETSFNFGEKKIAILSIFSVKQEPSVSEYNYALERWRRAGICAEALGLAMETAGKCVAFAACYIFMTSL